MLCRPLDLDPDPHARRPHHGGVQRSGDHVPVPASQGRAASACPDGRAHRRLGRYRATNAGIGTSYSTLSPTLYVGKGFGDLPDQLSWAQPFAVTLEASYDIPTSSFDFVAGAFIPQIVSYSASLQYSLPYLHANVIDLGLPDFFNHLIPLVEATFQTPVANNFGNNFVTTGFVYPGVIWVGSYFQVGVEAIIPINKESGSGVGVLAQLHLYLDDLFPNTYGQPLIGGQTSPAKRPFGG